MNRVKKHLSDEEALAKLQHYCAYQDRCHAQVRSKLLDLEIYGKRLEQIISRLIQDNFLNEERFACSYARGKFRFKKWGRIKIKQKLSALHISEYCIKKGMQEIEEEAYLNTLSGLLKQKRKTLKGLKDFEANQRCAAYVIRKGYEPELVWQLLKKTNA